MACEKHTWKIQKSGAVSCTACGQSGAIVPLNSCLRCGHEWEPKLEEPRQCPKCKSAYWNVPKK